jgi:NAD(P)H-dependent FMN reductase
MLRLEVIIVSTRPGRIGLPIGEWFFEHAKKHGRFEVELVDLARVNLPLYDEPKHPRFRDYQHDHTKAWSATVARADAYVFILPEYNYSMPPSLPNAIDYVFHEWTYKAAGIVSYGGIAAGSRSAQMAKQLLTSVKVMPMMESLPIPFASKLVKDGRFAAEAVHEQGANVMLDELLRWAEALATMRVSKT